MSRRLVWLVIPTLLTLLVAAPAAAAEPTVDYVALGDSYAAGLGAPGTSGLCLRGTNGYPQQWAAQNDPASFRSVACSGATTDDVRRYQVFALHHGTDLVTVTIGGNDVGFASTMITCTLGGDAACLQAIGKARAYGQEAMPARLDATYRQIRQRAPDATVVVLGYPEMFDPTASCGPGGMSVTKRTALNAAASDLDDLIAERAQAAGFRFADVRPEFDGHGICGPAAWVNPLLVARPFDSFHPTATGYRQGYLPALAAALS